MSTLGEVFTLQAGKNITAKDIKDTATELHSYKCYGGNGIRGFVASYNREGDFPIIGRQGALCGNINIAKGKFYATEHAVVVERYCDVDLMWAYYTLTTLNLNQYATATAQPGLSVAVINDVYIPVPPLKEQERISQEIEHWFALIDQIEQGKADLQTTIKQAKSKILDLAIHGKLVQQDPNDEPASVLLERIREEKEELIKQGKIKRDKMESVIFKGDDNSYYEKIGDSVACIDAELPFEIPDNWCWARLNCISINYDSYRKPINSYDRKNRVLGKSKDELYPYYGATGQIGFIDDFLFNGEYILLGEDAAPFLDKKAQKAYMIKGKSWVNNHAHILQSLVFPEYLTNCLNSIDYFDYVYGTTRLKLTQENMNRILVPVPSIEEQCKIAQAINNLSLIHI